MCLGKQLSLAKLFGGDGNALHALLQQRQDVLAYKTPGAGPFQVSPPYGHYVIPPEVYRQPAANDGEAVADVDRTVAAEPAPTAEPGAAGQSVEDNQRSTFCYVVEETRNGDAGQTVPTVALELPDLGEDFLLLLQSVQQREWYTTFGRGGIYLDATHSTNKYV